MFGLFRRSPELAVVEPAVPDLAPSRRRERRVDFGSAMVTDTLSVKLLHGWLQNRHQTLMPLTLNLSTRLPEQQAGLARILASLLLAGRPADAAWDAAPAARKWLADAGAGPMAQTAFDVALDAPLPLNLVFEIAQARDMTIYAYVAALIVSDTRYPVSLMLCDMMQARFDLPAALVRSAVRRYRR